MRVRTAALGALAAIVLGLTACTGSSSGDAAGSSTDDPSAALRAAVAATSAAGTARVTTTSEATVAGTTYPATTTQGVQALDGSRAVVSGRIPDGFVGSTRAYELRLVVNDGRVWFSFPEAAQPGISSWGTASTTDARSPYDLTLPAVWRLPDWLSSLGRAADVVDAGASTVGGVPARRFTAAMPRSDDTLSASLGGTVGGASNARDETLRLEVWVGQDDRLARIRQSWDATTGVGSELTETVTVDLADFGVPVAPKPPTGELSGLTPGQMLVDHPPRLTPRPSGIEQPHHSPPTLPTHQPQATRSPTADESRPGPPKQRRPGQPRRAGREVGRAASIEARRAEGARSPKRVAHPTGRPAEPAPDNVPAEGPERPRPGRVSIFPSHLPHESRRPLP